MCGAARDESVPVLNHSPDIYNGIFATTTRFTLLARVVKPRVHARHITILTFEGFNELDSLVAFGILNRARRPGWRVSIACPPARVRSMNGVVLEAQASLHDASRADVVLVGSGMLTRDIVKDEALMAELRMDSTRQLLGAQCSGTLVLAKLGLLEGIFAYTDLTTKPWVDEAGVAVLNQRSVTDDATQRLRLRNDVKQSRQLKSHAG